MVALYYKLRYGGGISDTARRSNHLYGKLLTRLSWPLVRVERTGMENIKEDASCVIIVNHRSTSDVLFGPLFTPLNTTVFVRSWPFKIVFMNLFMRLAGYIDTERSDMELFLEGEGRRLKERRVSFLLFPEGHRSRDGKLQTFHSGAFLTATELDIPVIPVCLTGTEKFVSMKDHVVRPATITVKVFEPVHPSLFSGNGRVFKMKKHVETLLRNHLDE